MKLLVNLLIPLMAISSCSVEPSEIVYGFDGCHFCKMTIVDRQHAAQLVTNKGKVYKYDAIECMINDLVTKESKGICYYLINDYSSPGSLIDATKSTYLISKSMPSPMGAFLNGFNDDSTAEKFQIEKSGEILTWKALKARFLPSQE